MHYMKLKQMLRNKGNYYNTYYEGYLQIDAVQKKDFELQTTSPPRNHG